MTTPEPPRKVNAMQPDKPTTPEPVEGLLPCPFCGGDNLDNDQDRETACYGVRCFDCQAQGKLFSGFIDSTHVWDPSIAKRMAAAAWNTRPTPQPSSEYVKQTDGPEISEKDILWWLKHLEEKPEEEKRAFMRIAPAVLRMALKSLERPATSPDSAEAEIARLRKGLATAAMFIALHFPDIRKDFEDNGVKELILENDMADENEKVHEVIKKALLSQSKK